MNINFNQNLERLQPYIDHARDYLDRLSIQFKWGEFRPSTILTPGKALTLLVAIPTLVYFKLTPYKIFHWAKEFFAKNQNNAPQSNSQPSKIDETKQHLLQEENQRLQSTIKEMESKLENMRNELSTLLQKKNEENSDFLQKITDLTLILEKTKKELKTSNAIKDSRKERIEELEKENNDLGVEKHQIEVSLHNVNIERRKTEDDLQEKKEKIKLLETQNNQWELEISRLELKLAEIYKEMETEKEKIKDHLKKFNKDKNLIKDQLCELESKNKTIESTLSEQTENNKNLQEINTRQSSEILRLKLEVTETQKKMDLINKNLIISGEKIHLLEREKEEVTNRLTNEYNMINKSLLEERNKNIKLQEEIYQLKQSENSEKKLQEIEILQQENIQYKSQILKIQSTLEEQKISLQKQENERKEIQKLEIEKDELKNLFNEELEEEKRKNASLQVEINMLKMMEFDNNSNRSLEKGKIETNIEENLKSPRRKAINGIRLSLFGPKRPTKNNNIDLQEKINLPKPENAQQPQNNLVRKTLSCNNLYLPPLPKKSEIEGNETPRNKELEYAKESNQIKDEQLKSSSSEKKEIKTPPIEENPSPYKNRFNSPRNRTKNQIEPSPNK